MRPCACLDHFRFVVRLDRQDASANDLSFALAAVQVLAFLAAEIFPVSIRHYSEWRWLNRFRSPCPRCPWNHGSDIYERDCCFPDCAPFYWAIWWWRLSARVRLFFN